MNNRVNFAKRGETLVSQNGYCQGNSNTTYKPDYYANQGNRKNSNAKESLHLLKSKMGNNFQGYAQNYGKPTILTSGRNDRVVDEENSKNQDKLNKSRRSNMIPQSQNNYRKKITFDEDNSNMKNNDNSRNNKITEKQKKNNFQKKTLNELYEPNKQNDNNEEVKITPKDPNLFQKIATIKNLDNNDIDKEELIMCKINCNRKFKKSFILKHEKQCKKAKEKPRKVFDIQAKRLTNQNGEPIVNIHEIKQKLKNTNNTKKKDKIPKWKLQSYMLRERLGKLNNKSMTNDDQEIQQHIKETTVINCPHCNRNFNPEAGNRHIPFCAQKAKEKALKAGPKKSTPIQKGKTNTLTTKGKPNLRLIK